MEPVRVAFLVFPGITQLDFTGPAQMVSKLGRVTIDSVAGSREPIATDCGFSIVPTATLECRWPHKPRDVPRTRCSAP